MQLNGIKKELGHRIDDSRDGIISAVRGLIQIPSVNIPPDGGEKPAQEYLKRIFDSLKVNNSFVNLDSIPGLQDHDAYYHGRNYHDRPNFIARYPGGGDGKSLLLSGHIDTMPVGDVAWTCDPFGGEIHDGKLYGRGAFDMKGGIGAMVMAIKAIVNSGVELRGDLLFESVVDEEHAGCNGTLANRLIGHNADAVILSEPSNMSIYPAHKGFRIVHLILKGNSGMAFAGEKLENPVEHLGRLIESIKQFRNQRRLNVEIPPIYQNDPDPVPVFITKLQAGEFSFRIPMTIPDTCRLEVYWQTMPGEAQEEIEQEFFDFIDEWCAQDSFFKKNPPEKEFSLRWMPGSQIKEDHPLVATTGKIYEENTGDKANVQGAPYPCDLFIFNKYWNIPGIILGSGGGNAHGADEFVFVDDLISLTKIYAYTILEWCGVK